MFHVEKFADSLEELKPLFFLCHDEIASDKAALSPNYAAYLNLETLGSLLLVAAREAGELVGYYLGFVAPGLHYETVMTLTTGSFFLHPKARGKFAGVKLFRAVEAEARRRGVDRIFVGVKSHKDASAVLRRLDYGVTETYYGKWIGD